MPVTGRVSLVGAGPGDPALLTRKAVARLRAADLVLFDALVDPRVLGLAKRAQRFFVGKRAGRPALSQREIQALMIRAAQRGRRVVRLKGGDPFVFGRGGEEAMALSTADVPFEVVPGVSSVFAGPAFAGIPVTHRGESASVMVTSGHDTELFARTIAGLQPDLVTLVIVMGWARRAQLAKRLLEAGWPEAIPAAVIANATWPDGSAWRGSLAALAKGADGGRGDVPCLIVVGRVAALRLVDSTRETVRSATTRGVGTRALRMRQAHDQPRDRSSFTDERVRDVID